MPGRTTMRIQLLDDSVNAYEVKTSSHGNVLLQAILNDLNILESDYFGAAFDNGDGMSFLDPLRQIDKQIQKISSTVLQFVVKFFTPDPSQIEDEYTRYLFALQIKRDINSGMLPCRENRALQIASYIVQAEFGDWNVAECSNTSYLNDMKIFPNPTPAHLQKISELHRILIGKTPAEADYELLENARHLEHYGIRFHPALDAQNAKINLAVSHAGVLVFQGNTKINSFNWARMRKLSFKRKRFLIKLRTDPNQKNDNCSQILVFVMKSRDACKNFWRLCIEHHAFFRLEVRPKVKRKPVLLSRGSSFHYNGKTQKELLDLVRNSNFRRTNFVRTTSRRRTQNSVSSPTSISEAKKPKSEDNLNRSNSTHHDVSGVSSGANSTFASQSMRSHDISDQGPNNQDEVTAVDVVADVTLKASNPEWQLESKSLHSSATPIQGEDSMYEQGDAKGNREFTNSNDHVTENGIDRNSSTHHSVNSYTNPTVNLNFSCPKNTNLAKNDSNVASVAPLIKNLETGRCPNGDATFATVCDGTVGFGKSLSFDPLMPTPQYCPPPLPPKERQLSNEGTYDNLSDIHNVRQDTVISPGQEVSSSGFVGLGDKEQKDPFVNDSVVNLAVMTPMTPDVKAKIGEQKIMIGHYSVPKKPPLPPDGEARSPRWKRDARSDTLDKEIDEAMTELYNVINEQNRKDGLQNPQGGEAENIGPMGIVVSSSEDEDEYVIDMIDGGQLSPEEDPLLAPIKMEFDDIPSHLLPSEYNQPNI